jgi:cytochrome c oxidase subunit 3
MADTLAMERRAMPVGSMRRHASGWWAMLCVILTEGAIFAYLLFSYFYFAIQPHDAWPPGGLPHLGLALPNTIVLIVSSIAVTWAERGIKRGNRGQLIAGLLIGLLLGIVFAVVQWFEWREKPFSMNSDAYGSLYFTTTGFHMAHVLAGLLILFWLVIWSLLGYFDRVRHAHVSIGMLYWHFVDLVWIAVFLTFYVTPHLG